MLNVGIVAVDVLPQSTQTLQTRSFRSLVFKTSVGRATVIFYRWHAPSRGHTSPHPQQTPSGHTPPSHGACARALCTPARFASRSRSRRRSQQRMAKTRASSCTGGCLLHQDSPTQSRHAHCSFDVSLSMLHTLVRADVLLGVQTGCRRHHRANRPAGRGSRRNWSRGAALAVLQVQTPRGPRSYGVGMGRAISAALPGANVYEGECFMLLTRKY